MEKFRRTIRYVGSALAWIADISAVSKIAGATVTAVAAGAFVWMTSLRLFLPTTPGDWVRLVVFSLLAGFGVLFLAQSVPNIFKQLLAPLYFKNLPKSHKDKLVEILRREPDAWRTTRNKAFYVDLSNKGLVRDVADLASKQVMVRLTSVGRSLAEEWEAGWLNKKDEPFVRELQAVWKRYGKTAVKQMMHILGNTWGSTADSLYWADDALGRVSADLEESIRTLEFALFGKPPAPLQAVRQEFNNMYRLYMDACEWVARINEHGDMPADLGGRPFKEQLKRWQASHTTFHERLTELVAHPEHEGSLAINYLASPIVDFERPELFRLLQATEGRANGTASPGSDTEADDDPPAETVNNM